MANIKETLKYAQEKLSKLHADEKDKNHIGLMVEAGFLKDVVEILGNVVTCEECRHGEPGDCGHGVDCEGVWHDCDWFCADGERRTGDV